MITRPLELESKLSAPPRDLDVLFWANVGAVALFFSLLGSRFVLADGVPVQVGGDASLDIPRAGSATRPIATSVVLSYWRDNMVIFEGGTYELHDVRERLEAYAKKHPGAVLLLKVDKQVSAQGLFDLFDLAKSAGFSLVQVAAEPPASEPADLVGPLR